MTFIHDMDGTRLKSSTNTRSLPFLGLRLLKQAWQTVAPEPAPYAELHRQEPTALSSLFNTLLSIQNFLIFVY
jgi:hypothetical protein